MEIMINKLDTFKSTVDYICDELKKLGHLRTGQTEKINLSLDLTSPEYITVEKDGKKFFCSWFKDGLIKEHTLVKPDSMVDDVSYLVQSVIDKLGAEKDAFEQKCYEAYQLDWMLSHGYSLNDLFKVMIQYEKEMFDPSDFGGDNGDFNDSDLERAAEQARDILLYEQGFGSGHVFVCKQEFLENEYLDASYMKHLLKTMPKADEMQKLYTRYTGNSIASVPETQVNTTAGILNVYKSQDPGQPGVVVMLQPQGYEDEIDCAYVSVYENPEYRTDDEENDSDVVIMSYGDATTEDYTTKEIIRRDDIIAGLGTAVHL